MNLISTNLLSLILFSPALVAVVVALLPETETRLVRWVAFLGSLITFSLALVLWFSFNPAEAGFQFQEIYVWYAAINSTYHVGVDGISLTMVMLTTLLTPLAILASFSIEENVKSYMILFFLLEMGMLGVFIVLDLLLFL